MEKYIEKRVKKCLAYLDKISAEKAKKAEFEKIYGKQNTSSGSLFGRVVLTLVTLKVIGLSLPSGNGIC